MWMLPQGREGEGGTQNSGQSECLRLRGYNNIITQRPTGIETFLLGIIAFPEQR